MKYQGIQPSLCLMRKSHLGHRPVNVKRAVIGSKGGWKLSTMFTCVALAKAGLVVGPLRPSGRPSVRNTLECQVCVICNSKSFHSFYSNFA